MRDSLPKPDMTVTAPVLTDTQTRLTTAEIEDLLAEHEAMCWWVARRVLRGFSRRIQEDLVEDVAAEVRTVFVSAAHRFNPQLGFRFSTYALRLATLRAIHYVSAHRRGGMHVSYNRSAKIPVRSPLSLDEYLSQNHADDALATFATVTADPFARESDIDPEDLWRVVEQAVGTVGAQAIRLWLRGGIRQEDVGRRYGRSRGWLSMVIGRLRRVLQKKYPHLVEWLE